MLPISIWENLVAQCWSKHAEHHGRAASVSMVVRRIWDFIELESRLRSAAQRCKPYNKDSVGPLVSRARGVKSRSGLNAP
jgi:hypothetical protein